MSEERPRERDEIFALQDNVLISITDGKMDHKSLRMLPPWRAVLLARVAHMAGAMSRELRDRVVKEARDVGGTGQLRSWEAEERLITRREAKAGG